MARWPADTDRQSTLLLEHKHIFRPTYSTVCFRQVYLRALACAPVNSRISLAHAMRSQQQQQPMQETDR